MVEEIWKVIEDSDGHYFISNLGHMKRDDYICYDTKGRKLKRKEGLKKSLLFYYPVSLD